MFVQFEDSAELVIVSVLGAPQEPSLYPHQAEVDAEDPRLLAFLNPVRIPQSVSKYQGMAALHAAGHLQGIETYMADPATPFLTRLAWQQIQVFERSSPMLQDIARLRGISDTEVDQLFITAASIQA